eukprot:311110_1
MMPFQPQSAMFVPNVTHVCSLCHQPVCVHNAVRIIVAQPPNFVFPMVAPNLMAQPPLFPPDSRMSRQNQMAGSFRGCPPDSIVLTGAVKAEQENTSHSESPTVPLSKSLASCGGTVVKAPPNGSSESTPTLSSVKASVACGKTVTKASQKSIPQSSRPTVPPVKSPMPSGETISKKVLCPKLSMDASKRNGILRKLRICFPLVNFFFIGAHRTFSLVATGCESDVRKSLGDIER